MNTKLNFKGELTDGQGEVIYSFEVESENLEDLLEFPDEVNKELKDLSKLNTIDQYRAKLLTIDIFLVINDNEGVDRNYLLEEYILEREED